MGSVPGNINNKGVFANESLYDNGKLNVGGLMNTSPNFNLINSLTPKTTRSGLKVLSKHNFYIGVMVSNEPGN